MTQNTKSFNPVSLFPLFMAVVFLIIFAASTTSSTAMWASLMAVILALAVTAGVVISKTRGRDAR